MVWLHRSTFSVGWRRGDNFLVQMTSISTCGKGGGGLSPLCQKLVLFQVTCPPGTPVEKGLTLHHCHHHILLFPTAFSPLLTGRNSNSSSSNSSWHAGRCRLPRFPSTRRQQLLRPPQLPYGRTTATAGQLLLTYNINLR
jgi:hypothetical protein